MYPQETGVLNPQFPPIHTLEGATSKKAYILKQINVSGNRGTQTGGFALGFQPSKPSKRVPSTQITCGHGKKGILF